MSYELIEKKRTPGLPYEISDAQYSALSISHQAKYRKKSSGYSNESAPYTSSGPIADQFTPSQDYGSNNSTSDDNSFGGFGGGSGGGAGAGGSWDSDSSSSDSGSYDSGSSDSGSSSSD